MLKDSENDKLEGIIQQQKAQDEGEDHTVEKVKLKFLWNLFSIPYVGDWFSLYNRFYK